MRGVVFPLRQLYTGVAVQPTNLANSAPLLRKRWRRQESTLSRKPLRSPAGLPATHGVSASRSPAVLLAQYLEVVANLSSGDAPFDTVPRHPPHRPQ